MLDGDLVSPGIPTDWAMGDALFVASPPPLRFSNYYSGGRLGSGMAMTYTAGSIPYFFLYLALISSL